MLGCRVEQGTREVRPGASLRVRRHAAVLAASAIAGLGLDAPLVGPSPHNLRETEGVGRARHSVATPGRCRTRPPEEVIREAGALAA